MRLIDADKLKDNIPEVSADLFENCRRCKLFDDVEIKHLIDVQPTIEAVPLEDYRSMEQTVHKLTQAIAEAEPIKQTIEKFRDYQIEWLTAHNDIEFCEEEENLIVRFLKDTAECAIKFGMDEVEK